MQISILKETFPGEHRAAANAASVSKLVALGAKVVVEKGLGKSIGVLDEEFEKKGATVESDRQKLLSGADIVLRIRKPEDADIAACKKGCIHISYLDPFNETELLEKLSKAGITSISMELIPRITRAQKMDALSSQASLGGYVAVVLAAERLDRIFPMMMTPAGTISPARVFIIGAGVAGLQAIATAKRLGARVDAFDTRPVVEEQVQSLGAKFVKVDLGDTGQTAGGYAKQLTEEQLEKQRQVMAKYCAQADVVITTAQVFGRKAPVIVTADMVKGMKPGAVVVDMAVETGGNVEGSVLDKEVVTDGGVKLIGLGNLPARVGVNATAMYAANLFNLVDTFWDKDKNEFTLDLEDEILKGCIVTHNGDMINEMVKTRLK